MPVRLPLLLIALTATMTLALAGTAWAGASDPPSSGGLLPPNPPSSPPTISGTALEGEVLTGDKGTWDATANPDSFTYEWLRCDAKTCETAGATDKHLLTHEDVGRTIKLRVTAQSFTLGDGYREADSGVTAEISPAPTSVPGPTRSPATSPPAYGQPASPASPPAQPAKSTPALKRLAPFPLLVIGGRVAGSTTIFTSVRLTRVPKGATVRISCSGRSCPFGRSAATLRRGSRMTLARLQGRLRAGTVITITVRKGRTLGKYTRLRIRRATAPARVDRCVRPGSSKPVPCR
jgi:hypothetical protein